MSGGKTPYKIAGQTDDGEALRQAARINDSEKLKELISKGAEVNSSYIGFTPLRWASLYGHKEAIAVLREHDARDDLFSAGARGDADALEEMLSATGEARGDVLTPNRGDETALMWTAQGGCTEGHLQCIKLLLKAKAQVNAKDQHGFTALMGASQSGHVEIMKILLNARADVNAREHEDGETAITMAMHCAQNEAVKCLIEFGATMPAGHERE